MLNSKQSKPVGNPWIIDRKILLPRPTYLTSELSRRCNLNHKRTRGVPPYISHIGMCPPKSTVFGPFWSENRYKSNSKWILRNLSCWRSNLGNDDKISAYARSVDCRRNLMVGEFLLSFIVLLLIS